MTTVTETAAKVDAWIAKEYDSLKAKSGATLLIAQKPEIINGEEWYQLITAKPLRLN